MREIIFRGKTKSGEWLEWTLLGALFANPRITTEIELKTVGTYTGITDKNGKRIFEGDIVRIDGKNYEVQYLLGQFFVGINMPIAYKRFECEVIGNIHDNPELLE